MTVIDLPSRLLDPLRLVARRQEASVEQIVEDLIDRFLREQRHAQLLQEMERFRQQHAQLVDQYRGESTSACWMARFWTAISTAARCTRAWHVSTVSCLSWLSK